MKYSKTLLKFMDGFVNHRPEETKIEKYKFTSGIIHMSQSLIATDKRFLIEVKTEGIPQEMIGKSFDVEGNLIDAEVDTTTLQMILMKRRPNTYEFDVEKWEEAYNKIKKYKKPKSFGKMKMTAPGECINFNGELIVKADYFNNVAKICKKYGITTINYSNDSYMVEGGGVKAIGTIYGASNFDIKEVPSY